MDIDPLIQMENKVPVQALLEELRYGLSNYWRIAEEVLRESGIRVKPPGAADFSFKKNFFSFLFLYSFLKAGIGKRRRILYAAMLQCLRGMVTGCDNLLDDEYKETLDSNIPKDAFRFRSVIDIMVSDRVLFQLLLEAGLRQDIDVGAVASAAAASIRTMSRSGMQEASEERGIEEILQPEEILQQVHHYKTGILFRCPWDIPLTIEDLPELAVAPLLEGLHNIGMGCQIMDDVVDFMSDLSRKHHNYLVSLIHWGSHPDEKDRLRQLIDGKPDPADLVNWEKHFPKAHAKAMQRSHRFLETGLGLLFSGQPRLFVDASIRFLEARIGAADLLPAMQR
jgi:Polyprenyl synthetase